MKRVHVAVAVIHQPHELVIDADPKILITKRSEFVHQGGCWEFPGGKVDPGETVQQALCRELHEELGISVSETDNISPLIRIPYNYPDKQVLLDVWNVHSFEGEPSGCEGQPLAWVPLSALDSYRFPAANQPIIDAVRLPSRYLITPEFSSLERAKIYVQQACQHGFHLIQLRQHQLDREVYRQWAQDLRDSFAAAEVEFIWNRSLSELQALPEGGWHLNAKQAQALSVLLARGAIERQHLLGVSCHNAEELELAQSVAANYALLSPIEATQTHPNAETLGMSAFKSLVEVALLPVYALGGMTASDVKPVQTVGGQGVAAISAWANTIFKEE